METKGKEAENYISALQRKNKKRTYNDNKVTNIKKVTSTKWWQQHIKL